MSKESTHRQPFFKLNDIVVLLVTVLSSAIFLTVGWFCNTPPMVDNRLPELAVPQAVGPLELALAVDATPTLPTPLEPVGGQDASAPVAVATTPVSEPPHQGASPEPKAFTRYGNHVPFHGIIVQVAGRYEVDPHLIRAIIFAESGYNPKAKSKRGARGLMQLMPTTARALGVKNVFDPEENIDGGVRYFRSLLDRFEGDVKLALAAYNAGSRHVRNYEGIPPFKATQHYIKKVLKFHQKFKAETKALARKMA